MILVKELTPEEVKALKRLKIELDAKTWRELLLQLAAPHLSSLKIRRTAEVLAIGK